MSEGGWWEIGGQRASDFPLGGRLRAQQDDRRARAELDEAFTAPPNPSGTFEPFVSVQFDTDSARWVVDHWSARDQSTERSFARLDAALTSARKTGALLILGHLDGEPHNLGWPTPEQIAELEARALLSLNGPDDHVITLTDE